MANVPLVSSVLHIVLVVAFLGALTAPGDAKYKAVIGGITVSYSNDGATAFFDPDDGTLTILVAQSGGSLNVVVSATAFFSWGSFVDIYIVADDAVMHSIKIKSTGACVPFVCGQVGYVQTFSLTNGVVGDTETYGQDFGLGMVFLSDPAKISIQQGYATAQVLGFQHPENGLAAQKSLSAHHKLGSELPPATIQCSQPSLDKQRLIDIVLRRPARASQTPSPGSPH